METKIVKLDPLRPEQKYIKEAAEIIRKGGFVIVPTDTVYGIAANMSNKFAIDKLYEIKQRLVDKPFSLHISRREEAEEFCRDLPREAYKLMEKFWPGPLTLILKSKDSGTIGMRLPDDRIALEIITQAGVPVVCPSANISGKPAPINFQQAIQDLSGLVDLAIDAGPTKLQAESTIVDLTVLPLQILREGALKKELIEKAAANKRLLFVCTGNSCRSVMAKFLLEKKLKEKNRVDVEVLSAGIMMSGGLPATENTKEVLRREGLDASGHLSQPLSPGMIKSSDIILVMERLQEMKLQQMAPEAKNRVFLLKEFAKIDESNLDIEDPIGRQLDFYEKTCAKIKEAVERIAEII